MREIKFRGKRIDNGELACGHLCYMENEPAIITGYVKQTDGSLFHCNTFYFIIPETVGQYTGLKDKSGVEIYEGDIVKDEKGELAYVAFLKQEVGFVLVYKNSDSRFGHRNRGSNYDIDFGLEVIGNIHDNPELLEASV